MSEAAAIGVPDSGGLPSARAGSFVWQQLRATPLRILLNFLIGVMLVFGAPPLIWARNLFDPAYVGLDNGGLWSEFVSYTATFENSSLFVILTAILVYAVFASTVVFIIKELLIDWYTDIADLGEIRHGLSAIVRLPLRVLEHFFLWLSIALTWMALGVCYEAVKPNHVFEFSDLWAHYQAAWSMLQSGDRLDWQLGVLLGISVPSAIADAYVKRRFIRRLQALTNGGQP